MWYFINYIEIVEKKDKDKYLQILIIKLFVKSWMFNKYFVFMDFLKCKILIGYFCKKVYLFL